MIYRYLPFVLTLRAPAVLTSPGGDPNSSRTLPFIPGSALRGAAARVLGDPGNDAERQSAFRSLILAGSVAYLNAYPRAGERRALPAPISLRVEKGALAGPEDGLCAHDLAAFTGEANGDRADWPEASLTRLPEPFVSIGAAQPLRVAPSRGARVHQQRDRARGRAWKEERDGREEAHGTVFAFEYLEADQDFEGLILLRGRDGAECDGIERRIRHCLADPLLLGRSRRAGYGGESAIEWLPPREREVEGEGVIAAGLDPGTQFRALLTSAYIGRDPGSGQIDPARLACEITAALSGRVRTIRRCWAFDRTGGFNRKWRLEVPQALTCTAGSLLVLEATDRIPLEDLLAVENAGLGERRVEGFGRLVFLEAPARTLTLRPVAKAMKPTPEGEAPPLVRFVEERLLDAAVGRAIGEEAARLASSASRLPSPSLIGRLRNVLRAPPGSALETLVVWLGQGDVTPELKRPARDQLERCRIGGNRDPLSRWLQARASVGSDEKLESLLRYDAIAQRHHVVSEKSARAVLDEQATSIRARLIDATLAALARRARTGRSS